MRERRPSSADVLADLARFPEMNPGPVLHTDRDGTILLANQAAKSFFAHDSLVGLSWPELCDAMPPAAWRAVLDGDEHIQVELDRGGRCVLFTHVRSPTDHSVFAFGADITERRDAERQLATHAARLAEVARFPDMNPGPVIRTDLAGCVLLANVAAQTLFGEGLAGRSWLSIHPGVDAGRWSEIVASTGTIAIEARLQGRDFVFTHRRDHQSELVFIFGSEITALRQAEHALRQSEKLATLGTLAAGVAHELNNPAAAARRAAEQLRIALTERDAAQQRLATIETSDGARSLLVTLDGEARARASRPQTMDALTRSDREAAIESWLEDHGVAEGWTLAPALTAQCIEVATLDRLAGQMNGDALSAALAWLAGGFPVYALVHELGESASRISEIVRALKGYTFLGQAPVQAVDLREGLDDTLIILRSKLKEGVTVRREYDTGLPRVPAHGSELNQVWTNLMDNAIQAMRGKGTLTIRTRRDGDRAIVEIEDDGPGIPSAIQPRVFDPFFTTKEPGQGTGLGLSTSHSIIVEQHAGRIALDSRPGRTRFTVSLPLEEPRS